MPGRLLSVLLPIVSVSLPAEACNRLLVYDDVNRNSRRDVGETGIAGVRVSDGRQVVVSGSDGTAAFVVSGTDEIVFVIKPPGYRFAVRDDGLPDFWRSTRATGEASCGEIALIPEAASPDRQREGLNVLVMADPQPKSMVDVDYYQRDVIASALSTQAGAQAAVADMGITLGDLVDDELTLYPAMVAATGKLELPWLYVAGNHDLDGGDVADQESLATFRRSFGPDSFAWEEPEASFVVLDDVIARPGESPAYIGGLREAQFEFLEAYLSTARRDRLLVVALHIPLFEDDARDTFRDGDRTRLFSLLQPFPHVLVLSGHEHTQRHVFHGREDGWEGEQPLHEYSVGAAAGAYWTGVKDADGIPETMMADGTPNGHASLSVRSDGQYKLRWHPARLSGDTGIGLHAPKVLRRGAYPGFAVYANVYMGHSGTRVEYRIDDGDWQPMSRVLRPDPRLLAENVRDDEASQLRGYDRAVEAEPSTHLWRGKLPTSLDAGEHRIDVRAFDDWRGELRASTRYRLEEAQP